MADDKLAELLKTQKGKLFSLEQSIKDAEVHIKQTEEKILQPSFPLYPAIVSSCRGIYAQYVAAYGENINPRMHNDLGSSRCHEFR